MPASLLLACALLPSAFGPAVRVDRENRPGHACYHADITVSPEPNPTVYCVFEDDSAPFTIVSSDIAFQRSTDQGQTWLDSNIIVFRGNRFACYPDLKVADDGTLLLVFIDRLDGSRGHVAATRSTDSGRTWSVPVQVDDNSSRVPVGWARLALDSSDRLFCAWTDQRGQYLRVYSDVSSDQGRTWGTDVRVDDDTVSFNCYPPDVYVQPGSNDYLVVADAPVRQQGRIVIHSHFYRSTDGGRTFAPGFQLDTFPGLSRQPHIVADSDHVITDYTGDGWVNQCVTMARTWFEQGDSWGPQVMVTPLDTIYSTFTNGSKLAIDPSGKVHIGLMFDSRLVQSWDIWYAFSTDHGITWSDREEVSCVPMVGQWDPTIAADDAGHAYLAWQDMRNTKAEIWYATNAVVGLTERSTPDTRHATLKPGPSIYRGQAVLHWPLGPPGPSATLRLFDAAGREVRSTTCRAHGDLALDASSLPSGVYTVRLTAGPASASQRIVLSR